MRTRDLVAVAILLMSLLGCGEAGIYKARLRAFLKDKTSGPADGMEQQSSKNFVAARSSTHFGDRKPWEGRQESYNVEFQKADFFTKIRNTWVDSHVGSLKEAMKKPLCGVLNATANTTFSGKWYSDDDGHLWWEPENCRLRRLSAVEARQCLSGRHIFMAGDSLTRYQYLSLVSFLSKGEFMAPWAHSDVRSLAVEREWKGWDDFFQSGSQMLSSEARNASASESCECYHGAFGSFRDVPSHEQRAFALSDYRLLDGNPGQTIDVTNKLVYNNPSHVQAGIEALAHGLLKQADQMSVPDLVILNMGIWVADVQASAQVYKERFEHILKHGNYFNSQNLRKGKQSRLFWKTTTKTIKATGEEEQWDAVNEASLRAYESVPDWQLFDVRALSRQALEQHLNLYSFDEVHFDPQVYQEYNDLLLNIICSPDLKFQTGTLLPEIREK